MILEIIFRSYSSYHINKLSNYIKSRFIYMNLKFKGPIFLPKKTIFLNLLRSPHIDKDSRDQIGYNINCITFHIYNINKHSINMVGSLNIPPIVRAYYKFLKN
ncbi:uS10/mL48 family ribosomal protein [Candidatus Vidania fulgoroideae]|uniref:US10/mL48 family ribosomal protein n=1 Tax=Candidatus Vidania fulgoroideorum TaxID=881286 RepID=A0A975AEQ1_9PROT|nr:uS10/mL48 family ribosomal protein [Candidatus Vidania fulgoroideae]